MSGIIPLPEFVTGLVQYYIANRLLDAQKDARERLSAIALQSLEKAEELFAAFMELREYDQQVYDWVKNLPSYSICEQNIQRGRITGHLQQAELIKRGAFGHSRYNCGNREEAISLALSASLITAGERMVDAHKFEELMKDGYDQLRWTSASTSAAFDSFNPSTVLGNVAESIRNQDQALSQAANAGLFALGNTAKGLVRDVFSSNPTKVGGEFDSISTTKQDFDRGINIGNTSSNTTDLSRNSSGSFSGRVPTVEI